MSEQIPQNVTDIVLEKLSTITSCDTLDDAFKIFTEKLNKNHTPIDHIKYIMRTPFNSYDVFNKPDAPRDKFLDDVDAAELKSLNERFIKLKSELHEYSNSLKHKYNEDLEKLDENESDESAVFIEKFATKCYELRKDHELHTVKILYNFLKNNKIDIN